MSGWAKRPVSSLLVDASPGFASGEDLDKGTFQIRMNNVTSEGALDLNKRRRVTLKGKRNGDLLLKPGDVLFNSTNSPELVGKSALFPVIDEPATFSNHFVRLRPIQGELHGSFLARWLHVQFQGGVFRGLCKQWVNQATVSRELLLALELPLPPLPEQRRIAVILDQADALRAKRREALAQLDSLTQSIFIEMFGDPVTNRTGWPTATLKTLGKVITGGTPPGGQEGMFDGPIPFLTPSDLESVAMPKRTVTDAGAAAAVTVRAGATLVCCIGATIGKTDIARVRSAFNQQLNAVDWGPSVSDIYGLVAMRSLKPVIVSRGASTTLPILKKSAFEELAIAVPPLALQQTFATRIQAVESLKTTHRAALAELDALFASLQHRAFSGTL